MTSQAKKPLQGNQIAKGVASVFDQKSFKQVKSFIDP